MYLFFGLGNPTKEYRATRHNIGFDAITGLSDKFGIPLDFKKNKGLCGKGTIGGQRVLLVQPQTFMNLSGECVRAMVDFYKVDIKNIVVICDDINLPPGHIRIRAKGSSGGQNGLKNIIAQLGTEEFTRIRIGVGEKPKGWDLADYVLGHFNSDEEPLMREAIGNVCGACEAFVNEGLDAAMNKFNTKHS